MNIQTSNVRPVSQIQGERQTIEQEKAALQQKVVRLEAELAAEKNDKLTIMEATAQLYEELLMLKEQMPGGTS
ncbi:hypothetical protein [Brevibacillus parabrevis]|uniref:hypothetical protein n=1 Tax=Brevibacillus parabrevis TaxID=54914 RepID=UPI0028531648|nr:hypothetical protein [Brevibacillus parabrevis]MDR4997906.1 hypothetical protein [Brevibacillus parabrevis]